MELKTVNERLDHTMQILKDPDLNLSPKEILVLTVNTVMYEVAVYKRWKAHLMLKKYANKLNVDTAALALRKSLKDL